MKENKMKKLIIIFFTTGLNILAAIGLLFYNDLRFYPVILIFMVFGLSASIIGIYIAKKEQRVMHYLLEQSAQQKIKSEKDNYSSLILQKKIEFSMLQSQINPHFLYNTLDSIRGQALLSGQNDIAEMTERLSKFFRYCISSKGNLVKLSEEINNIKDYFCIQKYRFGERFKMDIHVEKERILEYYIPKISLQPIIENAISHGLEVLTRQGSIRIHIRETDRKVYIPISDNGIGMTFENLQRMNDRLRNNQIEISSNNGKHTGIAIMNVNSRIKICFGEEYGLHFRSVQGEGTDVEIILPIVDDFSREKYENRIKENL